MKATINKLPNSEIEIIGEINTEKFSSYEEKAIKSLNEGSKLDGFRPGHIPKDVLIKNLGEMAVLEEMAEMALRDEYPDYIEKNQIEVIGRPSISITKIAKNNPLEFKIKTAVIPNFEIPEYKKIAKEVWLELSKEKIEVTDKEIDNVIDEIRKARAEKEKSHSCESGNCSHEKSSESPQLPELNDEFVKSLGNFKDLEDLKKKIKENLEQEKKYSQKEKGRNMILENISKDTKVEIPNVLLDSEIKQIISEMKGKIEQLGINYEEYLKKSNKNEDEIKKEAEAPAKKRVLFKLILKNIAKKEDIKIPEDQILEEVEKIMKYYENADFNSARIYIEEAMTNEKVFEMFDNEEVK